MPDYSTIVMFPYPSGAGLHLGHYYNYAIVDSYCRWLRRKGLKVFQPFGYDAFGLPAENYARSIGGDPQQVTLQNIGRFRQQMDHMNTQFEEKLITCEPSYIKWTQWVFSRLKEKGLAYKAYGQVNYCPSCETVLANEQVKQGKCDRCSSLVESKSLNQWYFKITDYRDRLIKNLEWINYPSGTKKQQRVWLENLRDWCVSRQRKWGCPIPVEGETDTLDTFVDSSFYYLRYLTNSETEFLPKGAYKPIDLYVGGNEHACMHLIYARFIHMFLYDLGIVPQEEPFNRVIHQGMITCDGSKMSKSKGNAVNPDDFNPDELRMFLMFLGHYFDGGDWDGEKIVGISRFLERMRKWLRNVGTDHIPLEQFENTIDSYVSAFKFNKVISEWMIFYNQNKEKTPTPATCDKLVTILKVFAPGFES
jgi:leucyl-tRNA synthetase